MIDIRMIASPIARFFSNRKPKEKHEQVGDVKDKPERINCHYQSVHYRFTQCF